MSKIIGVTVGSPLPKPNLMQTDPAKGDYVKGKEEFLKQFGAGKDGASAYEIAVKNGFGGTEAEWLASLNGKDAEDGHTPVKGTDYFTEAEKDEFVSAVVARLPIYDGEVIAE